FPTARVEVEIAAPSPAAVRDALRVIPGAVSVSDLPGSDGIGRYAVESARGRDVRGEVFQLAAQRRWDLRELRRMGMTLAEVILLFMLPLVTMRLFAEERRSGTIELLLTYPVRDGAVLLAKFLAAFALYALMIALTLLYPAIIWYFAPLEWGPILTAYVGLLLMGGAFIAVGVFASSLTEHQIVAAL